MATQLTTLSDKLSDNEGHIDFLSNSQNKYHQWNNTYRVQKFMVLRVLKDDSIDQKTLDKVEKIYKTKSVNKAVDLAYTLFQFNESEILKYFIQPAIKELKKYTPES